jgi:Ca-activated chloride channel family protein
MWRPRLKYFFYGVIFLCGVASIVLAHQQRQYGLLLTAGHRAVTELRFDSQDYVQASRLWFANQERLRFNQGVLAYAAGNLRRATDLFREVSQRTPNPILQTRALYNLSVVLLQLEEVRGAAELLKEALRLDPHDKEAKFALEQLYQSMRQHGDTHREANGSQASAPTQEGLQQAPGQQEGKNAARDGQGRSVARPDI